MKKKEIVTNQMKYEYSAKVVFNLYMDKLITEDEYRIVLTRLKAHYKIIQSND
ncbi:MAG: SHOCT domain-containing protein [Bacillota bacterium]